ncbi:MAG TPA: hypothetical protein VEA37_10290, partial [Flavobacterium sp.]|nr:hypothetical protein [Flavobacterium sp.]
LITFFGTMVRAFIIGWVGWKVGTLYISYAQYIAAFEKTGLIAIVTLTTLYLFYRIWRRHLRRKS